MSEQNLSQNVDERPLIVVHENTRSLPTSLFQANVRVFLIILPLITVGAFSFYSVSTISDQLVYKRIGESINQNSSYKGRTDPINCASSIENGNKSSEENRVQKEASDFLLYMKVGSTVAALFSVPIWGAISDLKGRHIIIIASSIGTILKTIAVLLVAHVKVTPLWVLMLGDALHGLFGRSTSGLIVACAAIVGDEIPSGKKTFMMILMDFFILISETASQIGAGYALKYWGYTPILAILLTLQTFVLLYGTCAMSKFLKLVIDAATEAMSLCHKCKHSITKTFQVYHKARLNKARTLLLIIAVIILFEHVGYFGKKSVFNIYVLGLPLCWDSVMLGIFNGAEAGANGLVSIIIGIIFFKAGPNSWFVLLGLLGGLTGITLYGLSKTTLVMFIGLVAYSPRVLVPPVLRSFLSDLVLPTEQGAVMAGYVLLTVVAELISYIGFNSMYTLTISTCATCFLYVAAGFYLLSIFVLGVFARAKRRHGAVLEIADTDKTSINE